MTLSDSGANERTKAHGINPSFSTGTRRSGANCWTGPNNVRLSFVVWHFGLTY